MIQDLAGGSDDKESACNAGDSGSIPGSGRFPGEREWQPTPVFLSGKSHGQRSLMGHSPWGPKELDTAEWLTLLLLHIYAQHISLIVCWHKNMEERGSRETEKGRRRGREEKRSGRGPRPSVLLPGMPFSFSPLEISFRDPAPGSFPWRNLSLELLLPFLWDLLCHGLPHVEMWELASFSAPRSHATGGHPPCQTCLSVPGV